MQTARRAHAVSPLAIVLPHPPLPGRRSSLLSTTSGVSSPRTPRSCNSPSVSAIFFTNPKRNSTDSWNSSNPPDDLDIEWKQEDISLLSRTLDALPAHLVTPFIGPIPPNNLLDKLARGVSQAKGPADWPYSQRATRVKLLELARSRAKDDAAPRVLRIAEEPSPPMDTDDATTGVLSNDNHYSYYSTYGTPHRTSTNPANESKKPLYRQSSMDFMMGAELSLTNKENSARLSNRLHDRQASNPGFHPYSRTPRSGPRRSPSPSPPSTLSHTINPSTPSSSTLNSATSILARPSAMHRSSSSLTLSSRTSEDSYLLPAVSRAKPKPLDVNPPPLPPKDKTSLRYGTNVNVPTSKRKPIRSGDSPRLMSAFGATGEKEGNVTYPSSDEEEKLRSKSVKRLRGKHGTAITASPQSSTPESSSSSPPDGKVISTTKTRKAPRPADQDDQRRNPSTRRNVVPMNVQRNPSILGPELPTKTQSTSPKTQQTPSWRSPLPVDTPASPPPSSSPASAVAATPATATGDTHKVKTLRRVKRMPPARRISFGSIQPKNSQEDIENAADADGGLGSAFQLA
ncbi:hypothetical protein BDN72DRAFT_892533 [Pluteus cervinus]|uniref:Uncharacterized protein n=1 Tax=Pluteus cervinus TaxID=181527 RepID=A0ACD3BBI1_9AGAR|nr:hypothetical protein BDN72DRAFT_892533 [Pluteus cervinus]